MSKPVARDDIRQLNQDIQNLNENIQNLNPVPASSTKPPSIPKDREGNQFDQMTSQEKMGSHLKRNAYRYISLEKLKQEQEMRNKLFQNQKYDKPVQPRPSAVTPDTRSGWQPKY